MSSTQQNGQIKKTNKNKCRCCKKVNQPHKRCELLDMGATKRVCDDCFKQQELVVFYQLEFNKKTTCRCCRKKVARGHGFRNKYLICLECMYPNSHLEIDYTWEDYTNAIEEHLNKFGRTLCVEETDSESE